jgi:hypothetical protein
MARRHGCEARDCARVMTDICTSRRASDPELAFVGGSEECADMGWSARRRPP